MKFFRGRRNIALVDYGGKINKLFDVHNLSYIKNIYFIYLYDIFNILKFMVIYFQ